MQEFKTTLSTLQNYPDITILQKVYILACLSKKHILFSEYFFGNKADFSMWKLMQIFCPANFSMTNLTAAQEAEYREAFLIFDRNGDGKITNEVICSRSIGKQNLPKLIHENNLKLFYRVIAEIPGVEDCNEIFGTKPNWYWAKGNDSWGVYKLLLKFKI